MKGVAGDKTALKQNTSISTALRCLVEYNLNRQLNLDETASAPDYGTTTLRRYFEDRFPFKSVVNPIRPDSGTPYYVCRPKNTTVAPDYNLIGVSGFNDIQSSGGVPNATKIGEYWTLKPRIYHPAPSSVMKYYTKLYPAPTGTGASEVWQGWVNSGSDRRVKVIYTSAGWANKIVLVFEKTQGDPGSITIETTANGGGAWSTAASGLSTDALGRIELYRQSGGTWTSTPSYDIANAIRINGIRITASSPKGPIQLIEVSPRLIADMTDRLQDNWSWEANLAEEDSLHPIGTVSSNSGSISFDNFDGQLQESARNAGTCTLAELMRPDALITMDATVTPGTTSNIRQFTAYAEKWENEQDQIMNSRIRDIVGLTQAMDAPETIITNVTPSQAIWRLFDLAGINRLRIRRNDDEQGPLIPRFYSEHDQTLWDLVKSVCKDFKYSVWVDEDGYINVATRGWLFEGSRSTAWEFLGETSGGNFADVESLTETRSDPINKVRINYSAVAAESMSAKVAPESIFKDKTVVANIARSTRILWTPEDPVLLGFGTLKSSMNSSQTTALINSTVVSQAFWGGFSGYVLIDQEIIKYDGLEFKYRTTASSAIKTVVVHDKAEFDELQARALGNVSFTGKICNLERGQLSTTATGHQKVTNTWIPPTGKGYTIKPYTETMWSSGNVRNFMQIYCPSQAKGVANTAYKALTKSYGNYFARMRIEKKTGSENTAGMAIWAALDGNNKVASGIFFEATATNPAKDPVKAAAQNSVFEVKIYRKSGGKIIGQVANFNAPIQYGVPFEMTVRKVSKWSTGCRWRVYIDNRPIGDFLATNSHYSNYNGLALLSKGKSVVRVDYAGGANTWSDQEDNFEMDLRTIVARSLANKSAVTEPSDIEIDTFDDRVREIYVEDVDFQKGPALEVNMYPISNAAAGMAQNASQVRGAPVQVALRSDVVSALSDLSPWGARLLVANMSDRPVVLSDRESGLYPMLYGSIVERKPQNFAEYENEDSIERFGEKKFEATTEWVGSQSTAKSLATSIGRGMGDGVLYVELNTFTNHLLSLGDYATILYTNKGHTGCENIWFEG